MELFDHTGGIMKVEDNRYYIVDDTCGLYKQVDRSKFIEQLKKMSWVCLTSWDKSYRQQYLDLVDYVKEVN